MKEAIKKLTDAALNLAVAHPDEVRISMTRPYNHEDGNTYATDGTVVLVVPSDKCPKYEPFEYAKYPDVKRVMNNAYDNTLSYGFLKCEQLVDMDIDVDVDIAGLLISHKNYKRLQDITKILGISAWSLGVSNSMLVLRCDFFTFIIMSMLKSDNYQMIGYYEEADVGYDVERGLTYLSEFKAIQERDKEDAERRERITNCIYTFRVVKYSTMYIKASSLEEAEEIAEKYKSDVVDHDADWEVDGGDDYLSEPLSYMSRIFTSDGKSSYHKVMNDIKKELEA